MNDTYLDFLTPIVTRNFLSRVKDSNTPEEAVRNLLESTINLAIVAYPDLANGWNMTQEKRVAAQNIADHLAYLESSNLFVRVA